MVHLFVLCLLIQFGQYILNCIKILLNQILTLFVREDITGAHTEPMNNDPVMDDFLRLRQETCRCFWAFIQPNSVDDTPGSVANGTFV
jgi:hypothetical protein